MVFETGFPFQRLICFNTDQSEIVEIKVLRVRDNRWIKLKNEYFEAGDNWFYVNLEKYGKGEYRLNIDNRFDISLEL